MSSSDRPVIRLKPKADARRLRRGFPWVYDNELVLDRRTRALPCGVVARLEDAERNPLATVGVNAASRIVARVLDPDPDATIDRAWMAQRLRHARAHRAHLYDTPFYRLCHAEADGLPGVVVDRFGDAAVVQPNAAWADHRFDELVEAIIETTDITTVVKNAAGRARSLKGLDEAGGVVRGSLDGSVPVPMNGATYIVDLQGGQKTGLYFDQRSNHALAARLSRGGSILDVFSHVGASRSPLSLTVPPRRLPSIARARRWTWPKQARRRAVWQGGSPPDRATRSTSWT